MVSSIRAAASDSHFSTMANVTTAALLSTVVACVRAGRRVSRCQSHQLHQNGCCWVCQQTGKIRESPRQRATSSAGRQRAFWPLAGR